MTIPPSILLIDDSPSVREVLRVALKSEGYRVLEAADGREGVRLYREHRSALVLVDMVMPEKDGLETVKEIMAIDQSAVVFTFSGQEGAGDRNEVARLLGAKRGFEKPFKIDDLLGAIREDIWARRKPRVEKIYRDGFRVAVYEDGVLIEAVDYHTGPLFLDDEALAELGLSLHGEGGQE